MSNDMQELKERITGLSDEQLVEMLTVGAGEYRQEALDFAKAELRFRGVDFSDVEQDTGKELSADLKPFPTTARGRDESVCAICGGELRAGTLVADKELTIVFSDTREERFIKVTACVRCGQLSLLADFDSNVGS